MKLKTGEDTFALDLYEYRPKKNASGPILSPGTPGSYLDNNRPVINLVDRAEHFTYHHHPFDPITILSPRGHIQPLFHLDPFGRLRVNSGRDLMEYQRIPFLVSLEMTDVSWQEQCASMQKTCNSGRILTTNE